MSRRCQSQHGPAKENTNRRYSMSMIIYILKMDFHLLRTDGMAVDGWMFDVFVENSCIYQKMIITFFRINKSSEHSPSSGEDRWETGWMNTDLMIVEYILDDLRGWLLNTNLMIDHNPTHQTSFTSPHNRAGAGNSPKAENILLCPHIMGEKGPFCEMFSLMLISNWQSPGVDKRIKLGRTNTFVWFN